MMTFVNFLVLIIAVLVNVAFITLLERKILGYSQLRKGPNKVGFAGVVQPFNDAIKLFSKELVLPGLANKSVFFFTPALALALALVVFSVFPASENFLSSSLGLLFIYTILSMGVYPVLISGWSSNSKYAMLGSLRAVAQTVSYEVSLALIFLFYLGLIKSLSLVELTWANLYFFKILVFIPLAGVWLISCLAETNRTPFDFAEGESELVSGFNVEFGAVSFALIFMAEYASIFFMSMFFVLVFFSVGTAPLIFYILTTGVIFFWVWARTTLPRYRYDLLMSLAWKKYLPLTLFLLVYATALVI